MKSNSVGHVSSACCSVLLVILMKLRDVWECADKLHLAIYIGNSLIAGFFSDMWHNKCSDKSCLLQTFDALFDVLCIVTYTDVSQ